MNFAEVRPKLAAVLAPVADDDPPVLLGADAVDPPCLIVGWDEPAIDVTGVCNGIAQPVVTVVVGRVSLTDDLAAWDQLVQNVLRRLRDGGTEFGIRQTGAPRLFEIGGVPLIAGRIPLRVSVVF